MLGAAALSILFSACVLDDDGSLDGSLDGTTDGDFDEPTPWVELGEYDFEPEQDQLLIPTVEIPDGGDGFALFVEVEGCAQVALLEDAQTRWVDGLESGPSCAACEERFSVVAESGLLVHDPGTAVDGPAQLRLGKIACNTLTRARPNPDDPISSVRLWMRPLPERVDPVAVPLRFQHGAFSSWSAAADSAALLDEVSSLLSPVGVDVVLEGTSENPELPQELSWFEGDPSPLAPFVDPHDEVVDVVFGGCLEHVHPELGTRTSLEGFVPRVPAHGAAGGGAYLSGRSCTSANVEPTVLPIDVQARFLAHELGHYLGLYHVEDPEDGSLMHPTPGFVSDPTITDEQARKMRLHAALMAEGLPSL